MNSVIEVEQLMKAYPGVQAVNGLSFRVNKGEIFGLLGPNGAGKSTTLSIIEGLTPADNGRVTVLGRSIKSDARHIKARIGVQLQSTSLLPDLTAVEQIMLFARLYGRSLNKENALNLLEQVGLKEKASTLPDKLSGGQQQRLSLALAMVNDPEILFLDEPTAGLDPQARRQLWEMIRRLRDEGRTIVLTTHYLEEAEALCHRVGIIDNGRLLALDTPGGLINQLQGRTTISTSAGLPQEKVKALPGVQSVAHEGSLLRLYTNDVAATQSGLLALAQQESVLLHDMHIQPPSLEDVFLSLTGRRYSVSSEQ